MCSVRSTFTLTTAGATRPVARTIAVVRVSCSSSGNVARAGSALDCISLAAAKGAKPPRASAASVTTRIATESVIITSTPLFVVYAGLHDRHGDGLLGQVSEPTFFQSCKKPSSPLSVSGCLLSCQRTLGGIVQQSAPIIIDSMTCVGCRSDAARISVVNP